MTARSQKRKQEPDAGDSTSLVIAYLTEKEQGGYATPKGRAETRKRKVQCIKGGTPWYAGGDEGYAIQDEVIKNILKNRELVTRVAHEPCE